MDVSAYVLLSHEQALRRRMDVTANNLANVSTTGFKREQPVFGEHLRETGPEAVDGATQAHFVLDRGAVHDTAAGAFQVTGNPLDVMIEGAGYLAVESPDGGTAYTRAGHLTLLPSGELATRSGQQVLGEGGRPISVPPEDAASLRIAADGTLSGATGPLGRIAVTRLDEASVTPLGDNLFSGAGAAELPAAETRLKAGGVEGSNVQPVTETTRMVEILRAYQSSVRMSESLGDMRKRALERLGRVN